MSLLLRRRTCRNAGFTLVELSIVLVILGLLVGGVLTGQSLIRAAELRSVSTQYSGYVTAVNTFKDKYFALPGDMTNATAFWGTAAGSGSDAACYAFVSTSATTCNGNGDGQILESLGSNEPFRFWQHLANAGLIEGTYTGAGDGALYYAASAKNQPKARISSGLWGASYQALLPGNPNQFDVTYNNFLYMGGLNPGTWSNVPLLKPEDAYNIDMKMDDGKPGTGKMVVYAQGGLATCTTTSNPATTSADYLLTGGTLACMPYFISAF